MKDYLEDEKEEGNRRQKQRKKTSWQGKEAVKVILETEPMTYSLGPMMKIARMRSHQSTAVKHIT